MISVLDKIQISKKRSGDQQGERDRTPREERVARYGMTVQWLGIMSRASHAACCCSSFYPTCYDLSRTCLSYVFQMDWNEEAAWFTMTYNEWLCFTRRIFFLHTSLEFYNDVASFVRNQCAKLALMVFESGTGTVQIPRNWLCQGQRRVAPAASVARTRRSLSVFCLHVGFS